MFKKLILIDGSGFIFRAFHALPPLKRADGTPVGAVYGFCNMLQKFIESAHADVDSEALAVIFDAGRQTFRNAIYPSYKAHRPDVPEELIPQFSLMREACNAFNIPCVELDGYEADDLIATYAEEACTQGCEVVIVSSDKDLMQLIRPGVSMLDPIKNKPLNAQDVLEKFGVPPHSVIDVQALAGDASDNVPGVPGIGIKTAAELINAFENLENLLAQAHTIKQNKRREMLLEHAEKARISKQLVTLCRTAPLPTPLSSFSLKPADSLLLHDFLQAQNFKTLATRLSSRNQNSSALRFSPLADQKTTEKKYKTIRTKEELDLLIDEINTCSIMAVDCETTSLNAVKADLVGLSISTAPHSGYYIPVHHREASPQLDRSKVLEALAPLLTDPGILKVGQNIKYDLVVLKKYNIDISPLTDTMLMSYVLDGSKNGHGMDELAARHLNHQTITFSQVAGTGKNQKTFDEIAIDIATDYAAEDADITLQLYHFFSKRLKEEKMVTLYETIERPLISIIAAMEADGIKVDHFLLSQLGATFTEQMNLLEKQIHTLAGRSFNIGSPKQLGDVLFVDLNLPAPKKTKTGAYTTDVDVLEKLVEQGHVLPEKILEWRSLSKLKSTYVDGLMAAVNGKTQRVHTCYSLAGTSTGRLSSSDPNLQNIPIRTKNGRLIRQAFIAKPDFKLVSFDYSQIELRLLAHMATVPPLTEAFLKGIDIHTATAADIFGLSPEAVTPTHRRQAKAINFGLIYGISAFGLSQQLSIPQSLATTYMKAYFEKYPGIQEYMEACKNFAREHGYVQTLLGRKCYVNGIQDRNAMVRQFAERQAINAPLQGSNADIIKKAMAAVSTLLQEKSTQGRLLLQVHDELVFELPNNDLALLIPLIKEVMQDIVLLKVPLIVEAGVGQNWDEAH